MKKLLTFLILLFIMIDSGFAMEGKEEKISPKVITELNKLSKDVNEEIKEILTLEKIPSDLLLPILIQFSAGLTLADSLKAMKNFRLISKKFNALIEDEKFVTNMVNYWSKKYSVPRIYIPVAWSITLSDLPDELIMSILSRLASEKDIFKEIKAINRLRLVSKRFNALANNIAFVDNLINYWAKKYNAPAAHLAILWNLPGARKWLEIQDIKTLEESPKHTIFQDNYIAYPEDPPISYAIRLNRKEIIKILVNKKVDINQPSTSIFGIGPNAFMSAILKIKDLGLDLVKFFIEKGADVNYVIDFFTPLTLAIGEFDPELVNLLLAHKADPTLKGYDKTPLELAQQYKQEIELLLSKASNPEDIDKHKNDLQKIEKIIELLKEYGAT